MSYPTRFPLFNLLLRDTRGSILPMLAFGLLMLVTAVGVAIDLSREQTTHAKLNAALDASTIAAAKSISGTFACGGLADADACIQHQVSTVGTNYFNANYANAFGGTTDATGAAITPEFSYDYTTGNVIGTVNANTPTTFMQIVGQSTFPVQANSLTQASIFYLGQGITTGSTTQYLNPIAYNDTSTGLYSSQSWATAADGAQASATDPISSYNKGTNSIALSANGFDTLEIVPNTVNGVNDVVLGNNSWNGGAYTGNEFGPTLWFGGKTGQNSDPIYLQRGNRDANSSVLYMVIGDDYGSAFSGDATSDGDAFILGSQDWNSGTRAFKANFMVTSDGHVNIGPVAMTRASTQEGDATLEIAPQSPNFDNGIQIESPSAANGNTGDNEALGIFADENAAGSYNPLVQQGDHLIVAIDFSQGADNNVKTGKGNIFIGPWSQNADGLYVAHTGIGINNNTPHEALDVNGTALISFNHTAGTPSPRLGLVDTNVTPDTNVGGAAGETTSPAWYIDNDGDMFRIFRQPDITTAGIAYLKINSTYAAQFPGDVMLNWDSATNSGGSLLAVGGGLQAIGYKGAANSGDIVAWADEATGTQGGNLLAEGGNIIASSGYVQPGSNAGIVGTSCASGASVPGAAGAIKYDTTTNIIVYCNASTNLWTSIVKPVLQKTETWQCNFNGSGPCTITGQAYGLTKTTASVHDLCTITNQHASPDNSDTQVSANLSGSPGQNWTLNCAMSGSGGDCGITCYDFQ